ncbi:hypothetical protein SY89_01584 [Halolamina pelagica]|uniref:DUF7129 domain-containing protein n=1 Tax=Halolamina pelagica TaxID=699431 RepID=A0A0P7HBK9_9EURY|nr:hypothetical protein SY89_01584 [Halolamina pelagica]
MKKSLNEYRSERKVYECTDCLEHHTADGGLTVCPACGGRVENLTKDRAE